ncbi:MAG: hypothetical protein Q8936_06670 [Bacillota bacterium]|nr:hypothetical protein [Bacillota bacterium]
MAARVKKTIDEAVEIKQDEAVIYFKANRPLTTQEHKNLHEKIEIEMEKSGLKIILVPFLVDVGDTNE